MNFEYRVPTSQQRFELEIKRSQFLTTVNHTAGIDAARSFIKQIRQEMPTANHHCWAYVAGPPSDVFQIDQSDDGEPKGTAGKPILNVLQHAKLGQTTVVVTRYFGGIKLGAGGLVRAYTKSASQALTNLITDKVIPTQIVNISLPYSLVDRVLHFLAEHDIKIKSEQYTDIVSIKIAVPTSLLSVTRESLSELAQGTLDWQEN